MVPSSYPQHDQPSCRNLGGKKIFGRLYCARTNTDCGVASVDASAYWQITDHVSSECAEENWWRPSSVGRHFGGQSNGPGSSPVFFFLAACLRNTQTSIHPSALGPPPQPSCVRSPVPIDGMICPRLCIYIGECEEIYFTTRLFFYPFQPTSTRQAKCWLAGKLGP